MVCMERLDSIQKILIIRSATHIFHKAVNFLKDLYPEAEISVLTPSDFAPQLKRDARITEVFSSLHKGHFSLFKLSRDIKDKIKNRRYDLVVTLYNNDSGMGYLNVDLITLYFRSKYIMAFNNINECFFVTENYIAKKFFMETINKFSCVFSIFIFSIVFVIITITLLTTDCVRKFYLIRCRNSL